MAGGAVAHCALDPTRQARAVAIPQWMFETAACLQVRSAAWPSVSLEALLELKQLLMACALRAEPAEVLEAQHRSSSFTGGADATVSEFANRGAVSAVSSCAQLPTVGAVAARDPSAEREAVSAPAARALGKNALRANGRGGGR